MSLPSLKEQGWNVVDWDEKCPEVGDYIQVFEPHMGNKYSFKVTAIGDKSFLAQPTSSNEFMEQHFQKHDKIYVFKKSGSGHCLINGIGTILPHKH
jgi:hypothetical protein